MTTVFSSERKMARRSACSSARTIGSRAPSGSSSRITFGSSIKARIRLARCRWPPESSAGKRSSPSLGKPRQLGQLGEPVVDPAASQPR